MNFALHPWHLFFLILSGWVNRRQQVIIDFQNAQIRALMAKLGKKRILLTDEQRRLLAVKGKSIGRKALMELTTVVTPDTIMRWHRRLVAKKGDYSEQRRASPGRAPISKEVVELVLRMARENPTWGFDKIEGAIKNLGYGISDTTVGNILSEHGVEPAPDRKRNSTWKTSLKAHGDVLGAIDFGKDSLRRAVSAYAEHYHTERNHQELGNRIPFPNARVGTLAGTIRCCHRLGGLLRYYYRNVA